MSIKWFGTFKIASFLVLSGVFAFFSENAIALARPALGEDTSPSFLAQNIVPDNSLGEESSTVTPNIEINGVESDRIEGGAQRGANLFHSFSEFNVEGGRGGYFANPAGIENILGRVTGTNPSEILGTLGVQGNANLFLINPNGIIFGENARLDVGGSFIGSSANSIDFADGNQFSANKLENPPLLTINVPIGLGFLDNPGDIVNRSTAQNSAGEVVGLQVDPGNSISLIGGNVDFDGGNITAKGGKIELGGLSLAGTVGIGEYNSLNFLENVVKADINLSNGANVDVRGNEGSIDLNARNLNVKTGNRNSIRAGIAANSSSDEAQAGDITINVDKNIAVDNSAIANLVEANAIGNGGNINVTTTNLNLNNGARIEANTLGEGNSGAVRVTSDAIAIDTGDAIALPSGIFSQVKPNAVGNSGGVDISTTKLDLTNGGRIASNMRGKGNSGGVNIIASDTINIDGRRPSNNLASGVASLVDPGAVGNSGGIEITTSSLNLTNGARIEANTSGEGNSGSVEVTSDAIAIDTGESIGLQSGIFSQVEPNAIGNSGGVDVTTTNLNLTNGGRIASNTGGEGNSGGVNIASDTITVDGERFRDALASGIASRVETAERGSSGGVTISTTDLTITNGGEINVDTFGQSDAGLIDINASNNIIFDGENSRSLGSGVNSNVRKEATGNAGKITIAAANITMTNGGRAAAGTFTQGNAGSIDITASNNIIFDGENSRGFGSGVISSINKGGRGNAGKIDITTANLTITNGGRVDANTLGQGNAGKINVTATDTITIDGEGSRKTNPSSTITNIVNKGLVGNSEGITINTKNLTLTNGGLITSGTFGRGNAGSIEVTATDTITIDGENSAREASKIASTVNEGAFADPGRIKIDTQDLTLTNGGLVVATTVGQGNSGLVEITAGNAISIDGVNSSDNSSGILSEVGKKGVGNATGITVDTGSLSITNGGRIAANTLGQGNAGDIIVDAREFITLDGISSENVGSSILSLNSWRGTGKAGNISISTKDLALTNGGLISAATFGRGDAGDVDIFAKDKITVDGTTPEITRTPGGINGSDSPIDPKLFQTLIVDNFTIPSGINSFVFLTAQGNAGTVNISTANLALTDGAEISASTFGEGNAGGVNINATNSIFIDGAKDRKRTGISANAFNLSGNGGDVDIVTGELTIKNSGRVEAGNFESSNLPNSGLFTPGSGQPGDIKIKADSINLANEARIAATTQSETGIGGIINLEVAKDITLRNNSSISAEAFENADGGNVNIDTQFIIAAPKENNDIIADAAEGDGGDININADSLFGIEERIATDGNQTNDIDASSEFGLSGTVEINTPDVDRDRDLVQLPTQPTETKIVQACTPSDNEEQSEFVITGRGGLPPSPEDTLDSNATAVDWVTRGSHQNSPPEVSTDFNSPAPIVEAQGWIVDENNEVVLTAHTSDRTWQNSFQCQKQAALFDQNVLIASSQPESISAIPKRISVERFQIEGNEVFNSQELASVLAPFTNKPLSFSELLQARTAITEYYTKRGYITSGAYIPLQKLEDKVVEVRVIEGYLEDIKIMGDRRLDSDYFSSRIKTAIDDSLQREELLSALQLLEQNPLIANLSAQLEAGTRPGASVLEVKVNEADSFKTPVLLDNRRTPSVGSFRRQLAINEGNLLGFGDNLFLAYSNTEGSDAFDGSYAFPFNASNGTITIRGGVSGSKVVEEPFNQLNILGDSHYYELSLRQPLVQTPTQEFALGITASRRNSDISSLLEEFNVPPSELSPGADESGETKVSALRFFQEWTSRNSNEVIAARSQFNLGLDAFDATVNDAAPDSRFFAWQGQAQWTRQLARDTVFLLRGGIQLATTSLLPSEQFGLGGLETLRGYRQDLLLTDNSAFATAEIRLPLFRIRAIESVFQLAPFFDVGTAWNNGGESREVAGSNTLASIGLGLRLSLFDSFTARFDWGIPLVAVDTEENTWQEKGLYFSLEHSPF